MAKPAAAVSGIPAHPQPQRTTLYTTRRRKAPSIHPLSSSGPHCTRQESLLQSLLPGLLWCELVPCWRPDGVTFRTNCQGQDRRDLQNERRSCSLAVKLSGLPFTSVSMRAVLHLCAGVSRPALHAHGPGRLQPHTLPQSRVLRPAVSGLRRGAFGTFISCKPWQPAAGHVPEHGTGSMLRSSLHPGHSWGAWGPCRLLCRLPTTADNGDVDSQQDEACDCTALRGVETV